MSIINTSKEIVLPGAIEKQEAKGQIQLINSTVLPVRIIEGKKETLENAGVKFRNIVPGDPLFCEVILPDGWIKRATDHSLWSELVDNDGNVRADIFYKAAFYNRGAHMSIGDPAPSPGIPKGSGPGNPK